MDLNILQAIRKSHCSRSEAPHDCVGSCTITPSGLKLECGLCGTDLQPAVGFSDQKVAARARTILAAAGLDWDRLGAETQVAVLAEVRKDVCPGCGLQRPPNAGDWYGCSCDEWTHHEGYGARGWRRSKGVVDAERSGQTSGGEDR